jgi:hypothetical protein
LGENCDAGLGSVLVETRGNGSGDVMAGGEMTGADGFIGQGAVNEDLGVSLDQGLDLGLPLLGADEAGRGEQGEDLLGAGGGAEEVIEVAAGGHAFAAFAGEDEGATGLKDAGAGAHAFDALVEVKVERIAAVGGDDDLERCFDLLHGGTSHEFEADFMGLEEVTGEDAGQLALFVEGHVEQKARSGAQGDVAQFFPERIAIGDSERGAWIPDVGCAMIAHDRFEAGATGHDAFGSAAEPCEEVGFNEARDDPEVRLDQVPVEQGRGAGTRRSDLDEGIGIFRFMVEHAVTLDDGGGEHALKLLGSVGSMGTELIEQEDVFARVIGQVFEQPWDQSIVRSGACEIREGDADAIGRSDPFAEWRGSDRVIEGMRDSRLLVFEARLAGGFDHRGAIGGEIDLEVRLAVGELDVHSAARFWMEYGAGRRIGQVKSVVALGIACWFWAGHAPVASNSDSISYAGNHT